MIRHNNRVGIYDIKRNGSSGGERGKQKVKITRQMTNPEGTQGKNPNSGGIKQS